jgi:putative NADPH-quinone reductase
MNCLIVIAHPERTSFENTKIVKTIQQNYKRHGHQVNVVDLYLDGYNPSIFIGDISKINDNAFAKSYRHLIKTSQHIWIISPSRWLSLSPLIEGFIDQVFINGFAFKDGKGLLEDKKLSVIVTSTSPKSIKWKSLNILWIRLRLMVFPQIFKFKNINVYQIWSVKKSSNAILNSHLRSVLKIVNNFLK